jgi:hypothetical protein
VLAALQHSAGRTSGQATAWFDYAKRHRSRRNPRVMASDFWHAAHRLPRGATLRPHRCCAACCLLEHCVALVALRPFLHREGSVHALIGAYRRHWGSFIRRNSDGGIAIVSHLVHPEAPRTEGQARPMSTPRTRCGSAIQNVTVAMYTSYTVSPPPYQAIRQGLSGMEGVTQVPALAWAAREAG